MGSALVRFTDATIVSLPFVGFYWFNESFQMVAAVYLAIIAFYTMTISRHIRSGIESTDDEPRVSP